MDGIRAAITNEPCTETPVRKEGIGIGSGPGTAVNEGK